MKSSRAGLPLSRHGFASPQSAQSSYYNFSLYCNKCDLNILNINIDVNNVVQIKEEMAHCLDFLKCIYGVFGFTFQLRLSTRPDKFLGEVEEWDMAEKVILMF